jgi:hypothetical protein
MKTTSIICAITLMIGLNSSAFAMHLNAAVDSQGQPANCGYQTVALDPNRQIARCY